MSNTDTTRPRWAIKTPPEQVVSVLLIVFWCQHVYWLDFLACHWVFYSFYRSIIHYTIQTSYTLKYVYLYCLLSMLWLYGQLTDLKLTVNHPQQREKVSESSELAYRIWNVHCIFEIGLETNRNSGFIKYFIPSTICVCYFYKQLPM
jgi:hypothetical protein